MALIVVSATVAALCSLMVIVVGVGSWLFPASAAIFAVCGVAVLEAISRRS